MKLKNTLRTPKCYEIIRKAERQLLNKHVRAVNKNIELSWLQQDTCIEQLSKNLNSQTFRECQAFISRVQEARYLNTLECQRSKFAQNCKWLHKWPKHNGNMYMYNQNNGYSNLQTSQHECKQQQQKQQPPLTQQHQPQTQHRLRVSRICSVTNHRDPGNSLSQGCKFHCFHCCAPIPT